MTVKPKYGHFIYRVVGVGETRERRMEILWKREWSQRRSKVYPQETVENEITTTVETEITTSSPTDLLCNV